MTKPSPVQAAPPATDLRQRAARARDAAGRFIKRAPPAEVAADADLSTSANDAAASHGFTLNELVAEVLALWPICAAQSRDDGTEEEAARCEALDDRRYALLHTIEALPATPETIEVKALALAWWTYAEEWRRGWKRSQYDSPARLAIDINLAVLTRADPVRRHAASPLVDWHAPPPGFMASPAIKPFGFVRIPEGISIELGRLRGVALAEFGRRVKAGMASEAKERLRRELHLDILSRAGSVPADALNLVGLVNLASATLSELQTVRDTAKCLGDVAYAFSWGDRCRGAMDRGSAGRGTAAHMLVTSLGDALTAVEYAAEREAERRSAGRLCDRKTRLYTLAPSVIDNEDPDELEAFAHELLDHATAQREGR